MKGLNPSILIKPNINGLNHIWEFWCIFDNHIGWAILEEIEHALKDFDEIY